MTSRRFILAAACCAAAGLAIPAAQAMTRAKFTQEALTAAQNAGKPILIEVHADWCPTCAKQRPIINSLIQQPELKDLVVLTVDFDQQKDVLKALGVTTQSTLIAMHGKVEKDRATGITAQDMIKALVMKTLA